ncbi:hypothetical protein ACFQZS_09795 [Mucilaginibacter calamicampi]|uniref:Colicin import membrane protein n=1 Tax=Mucilaginibacter calamicampi TaxID=1302352 RepID=A0ABW2YVG5_9SPHI
MKNAFKIALLSAAVFVAAESTTFAQEKKPVTKQIGKAAKDVGNATATAAKDVGNATATGAKAVGQKTSEVASKGAAAVANNRYEGHWALTGELVYSDEYGRYFYVDKKGHRQFITKAQMRTTKP